MPDTAKIAIRASTQTHLEIEDIQEGIVILKDGGACLVLTTTAFNFGLLSEKEQDATIYAYAALLNSLTYPIQLVIRSSHKDISAYLKLVDEAETKARKELIREQIAHYRQFVQDTVRKNNVLDKQFYLAIPMSALEIGAAKSMAQKIKREKKLPFKKEYILQRAKDSLHPKKDHLIRQLNRLGLQGRQLETQELIRLFFNIYNPESEGQQFADSKQYQTPIVQSARSGKIKSPAPAIKPEPTSPPEAKKELPSAAAPPEAKLTPDQPEENLRQKIDGLVKESS